MRKGQKKDRLQDFETLSKLGTGSFGVVYKVRNKRKISFNSS